MNRILLTILLALTACTPKAQPASTPQVIKIYASLATRTWLPKAYACADGLAVILSDEVDPKQADISIRMGEPALLASPAFQIGTEDLTVVTNPESQIQTLTAGEVLSLFTSPGNPNVEIWVFSAGEDLQQVFAREVLAGQPITSLARAAASPQQMSEAINQNKNAVGVLPGQLVTGRLRKVFTLPKVAVLALVKTDPQGLIKELLVCLQK
jgi:hypothetical protein